jgi:hypothetical protein
MELVSEVTSLSLQYSHLQFTRFQFDILVNMRNHLFVVLTS